MERRLIAEVRKNLQELQFAIACCSPAGFPSFSSYALVLKAEILPQSFRDAVVAAEVVDQRLP
jgi:hypothetical protein